VERAGLRLLETLIVDDGSTDRTGEMLVDASTALPPVRPIRAARGHRGKGAAIAEGVRRAEGDYVLLADADLSTPLSELHKLTCEMDRDVVVIGSRGLGGASVDRGPAHRKLMGRGFNTVVRLTTGLRVHDTQCGFKLMRADLARELLVDQECEGFAFDVELLVRASQAGIPIVEVPVLYMHDPRSRVQVVSATFRMLRDVLALSHGVRARRNQDRQPGGSSAGRPSSPTGKIRTPPTR
jgi:glycosyltransferase involved in cell wall biosynthesis